MNTPMFADLLKEAMGLEAASIGLPAVERAVRQRLMACGLDDPAAYWDRVANSRPELQELIEAVVVPETWFFRDREAFAALSGVVLHEWLQRQPRGVLRLLSLPCSTGEEPYSIAMALLDTGLPPARFEIDAIDISGRALELARAGVYGANSFRSADLLFRARHFERTEAGWRIADRVRECVTLRQGNLLALDAARHYDVIFCRNVFIYFDRATQDRAVRGLGQVLDPEGFLFVGPSETGLLFNHGFVSARLPFSFAFRKAVPAPPRAAPAPPRPEPRRRSVPAVVRPLPVARPAVAPAPAAAEGQAGLDVARRLADEGRLADAVACCEEYLRRHGPSADAYHLLGLARDAGGAEQAAAACYRKALYLDPRHDEALLHLALLLERQGDRQGADLLRQRMRAPMREVKR